jgi:hypothetical protein
MKWSAYNSGKVNTTKKIAKMVEADDMKEEHRSQIRTHTPEDIKKIESKWVGLTDEDRERVRTAVGYNQFMTAGEYADAVQKTTEDELKEKNA